MQSAFVAVGNRAGFLGNNDDQGITILGNANGGAMARAELKKLDAIIPQVKAPPVAPKKAAAASEGAN